MTTCTCSLLACLCLHCNAFFQFCFMISLGLTIVSWQYACQEAGRRFLSCTSFYFLPIWSYFQSFSHLLDLLCNKFNNFSVLNMVTLPQTRSQMCVLVSVLERTMYSTPIPEHSQYFPHIVFAHTLVWKILSEWLLFRSRCASHFVLRHPPIRYVLLIVCFM